MSATVGSFDGSPFRNRSGNIGYQTADSAQEGPDGSPDARIASVETTGGLTLYSRWGDWVGWLCALASAMVLLGIWRLGRGPGGGAREVSS